MSDTLPAFMKHPFHVFSSPQVACGFMGPVAPAYSTQPFGQTADVAS